MKNTEKPSTEQLEALKAWAALYGRNWKSLLRDAWMTGDYGSFEQSNYLQQIRNTFGPSWLIRVRLPSAVTVRKHSAADTTVKWEYGDLCEEIFYLQRMGNTVVTKVVCSRPSAEPPSGPTDKEWKAYVALMISAPNLLAQLEDLVRCIREGQLGDYSPLMDEIFDSEYAIRQAEGVPEVVGK